MEIQIAHRKIGEDQPVLIVAEMSANHLQKFDNAVKIIKAAKDAGADAIKLQTYTPDTITLDIDSELFRLDKDSLYHGQTLYQLYKKTYTPWEWQSKLKEIAENEGLIFFSSVFDKTAVDFLETINVPCYKIASMEITDLPLIQYTASKSKPIMISTGIASLFDLEEAVNACKESGNAQIILLKCTSVYPTPLRELNLRTIPDLAGAFKTIIGLSDHTLGISAPVASVVLGARVVEKHLTLNRSFDGPDAPFSLEPDEFSKMVKIIREIEQALGKVSYELTEKIRKCRKFSRSLFIVEGVRVGEIFTEQNIRSIRPANGLAPKYLGKILGKRASQDLKRGTPLTWDKVN